MYIRSCIERRFNRKLKLCKQIREEYANIIEFKLPRGYDEVYILSKEIVIKYSTVIMYERFNWIVCESYIENDDNNLRRFYKKYEDKYILFKNNVVYQTSGKGIDEMIRYFEKTNPETRFKVLNLKKLHELCDNGLIRSEILFSEIIAGKNIELDKNSIESTIITLHEKIIRALSDDKTEYSSYTQAVCQTGVSGILHISPLNYRWGVVVGHFGRIEINFKNMNRAIQGDEVYVIDGKVVSVISKKIRHIVGTIHRYEIIVDNIGVGYVLPIDRRLPELRVLLCDGEALMGHKVVVRVMRWDVNQLYPVGLVCKVLGTSGKLEDEIAAVMEEYNLEYDKKEWLEVLDNHREYINSGINRGKFINNISSINSRGNKINKSLINNNISTDNIINESLQYNLMENLGNDTTAEGLRFSAEEFSIKRVQDEVAHGKRVDLRDQLIFSIDPPGCTDIDDALHCKIGKIGQEDWFEIGVHIADVSLFVTEGSILDKEAFNRSTTVYLPNRRIDMLPPFISADLCSLHPGKERATISCVWKFSQDFKILETKIFRSLICSQKAFSYKEAEEFLEENIKNNEDYNDNNKSSKEFNYFNSMRILVEIAKKLRSDRFDKGSIQLNTEDYGENLFDLHSTVEEFMLLANISVGEFININSPACAVLRRHMIPAVLDLDFIDCSSSKAINNSLLSLSKEKATIFKRIIIRSMRQAVYFINSDVLEFSHYGLSVSIYTHFTSPIRRYADIFVHRILCHCLDNNNSAIDALPEIITSKHMSHINRRSRNALNISRKINEFFTYINAKEDEYYEGIIIAIKDIGYIVYIKNLKIEEIILSTDKYQLFDKLQLKLIKNTLNYFITRKFDFEIIENIN